MIKLLIKALNKPDLIIPYIQGMPHRLVETAYALYDSRVSIGRHEKSIFIDLGSNLGQGYTWFSKFFKPSDLDFELFEPNPNCAARLEEMTDVVNGRVKLNKVGAGVKSGKFKFYGLDDSEGGDYSQGGSIVKEHNSASYRADNENAIEIDVIDFSEFLRDRAEIYEKIVVKMDIEGAEVELLEKMISDKSINLINILYVEFHSKYQEPSTSALTKAREDRIIQHLKSNPNVALRIWH